MRMVLRVIVLFVVLGAPAIHSGSAAASTVDVIRPPSGTYSCPDGTSVVLPAGRGTFSAGRVVETGQVFVPSQITYTLSIGGEVSIAQSVTKSKLASEASTTCTTARDQVDEGGNTIGVFHYSVTGVVQSK